MGCKWQLHSECIFKSPPLLLPFPPLTCQHPHFFVQGGWVIVSKDDPNVIVAKSTHHLFVPTMDYEIGMGTGPWPVNRNRTIFTTSLVPLPEQGLDTFLVWYGAADANVAYATIQVTH